MAVEVPKVTVGILSFNRLHYLRAVLESAHRCIKYPNLEFLVIDGGSTEPGLLEYLNSLPWIDRLIIKHASSIECLNTLVSEAQGEYLLLWPDDVQFVVEGPWLNSFVETLAQHPWIGSISPAFLRCKTVKNVWGSARFKNCKVLLSEIRRRHIHFRFQKRLRCPLHCLSYGWMSPGIIPAGIVSFSRTSLWRQIGPWRPKLEATSLKDSSAGGEIDILERYAKMKLTHARVQPMISVAADIINDDIGCKAKVRRGFRYGAYTPPPEGHLYYKIYSWDEAQAFDKGQLPIGFEEMVVPLGFSLPVDEGGNLLKASINTSSKTQLDVRGDDASLSTTP